MKADTLRGTQNGYMDSEQITGNSSKWKTAANGRTLDGSISLSYYSYERRELERQVYRDSGDVKTYDSSGEKNRLLPGTKGASPRRNSSPSTGRAAIIMAACMFIHFTAFGLLVAFGVTYVELIRVFDAPRSQAALVQSVYTGMTVGGGVLFAGMITKYGVGTCVMVSSVTGSVGLLVSSYAVNIPMIIVFVGVVAGASMSVHFLSGFVAIVWTFSANRKLALSILTFGPTVGQITFPYLTELLLNEFNWNGTFLIISAFMLNSVPCGLILHFSKDVMKHETSGSGNNKLCDIDCLKDVAYMLTLLAVFLYASTGPVEQWFVVDVAVLNGLDRIQGTIIISLLGLFGLGGRIIGIVLLRLFQNTNTAVHLVFGFLVWGIAHVLVVTFKSFVGLAAAVGLRGLSAGMVVAIVPGLQLELRGVDRYPQTAAVCNFIGGFGQIIGGLAGGSTVDITGSYNLIFYIAGGASTTCSVLMVAILIVFKVRQRVKRKQARSGYRAITVD